MNHLLRKRAEIYAQLANVADLELVERWRKEKLIADVRAAGMLEASYNVWPTKLLADKELIVSWGNPHPPREWLPIFRVHPWAYKFINQFLDTGEPKGVRNFHRKEMIRPVGWKLENDRVRSFYDPREMAEKELYVDLVRVITQQADPFPFRRCALCKTIFVRFGKQKFCSKRCTDTSIGSRNEYMKNYMARNRLRKKMARVKVALRKLNPKTDREEIQGLQQELEELLKRENELKELAHGHQ
jgi:hypothetical protein